MDRRGFIKTASTLAGGLFVLPVFSAEKNINAKYVFYFIGDGMGISQRYLTEKFLKETQNKDLEINKFPFQAITTTYSANSFITDSAASGTALACGEKTNNSMIGMLANGTKITSVAEQAKRAGYKIGIVTSVTLNHATPASFYGHRKSRSEYYELGLDLIDSNFDYFGGGAIDSADNKKSPAYKGNIYELAKSKGYKIARGKEDVLKLQPSESKVIAMCKDETPLTPAIDRENDNSKLSISDFTAKGIELLSDGKRGFFMMIEGGQIDWMCHKNDASSAVKETLDMENAVKIALEFAKQHPSETLIVITADHETGGLGLGSKRKKYDSSIKNLSAQKKSSTSFARDLKNAFKKNPDISFKDIKPMISETFGFDFESNNLPLSLKEEEIKKLEDAFEESKKETKGDKLALACTKLIAQLSGIDWTTPYHSAQPVLTTAYGMGAANFANRLDNTDIPHKIADIMNLK